VVVQLLFLLDQQVCKYVLIVASGRRRRSQRDARDEPAMRDEREGRVYFLGEK
jgi:hypothetical protein